jgi:hypothetical protein
MLHLPESYNFRVAVVSFPLSKEHLGQALPPFPGHRFVPSNPFQTSPPPRIKHMFGMAKSKTPPENSTEEKPITPPKDSPRPGTSGTELGLRANREKASTAFQRAQRAEQVYRAKRKATGARKDASSAKEHFKEGFKHLKLGFKCAIRVGTAAPAVLREKQEEKRAKSEIKKREQVEEKKRKLEEELKKAEGEDEVVMNGAA